MGGPDGYLSPVQFLDHLTVIIKVFSLIVVVVVIVVIVVIVVLKSKDDIINH